MSAGPEMTISGAAIVESGALPFGQGTVAALASRLEWTVGSERSRVIERPSSGWLDEKITWYSTGKFLLTACASESTGL